jgi:hypothetical protein
MARKEKFVRRPLGTPEMEQTIVINFVVYNYRRVSKRDNKHRDVGKFVTSTNTHTHTHTHTYIYIYIYIHDA